LSKNYFFTTEMRGSNEGFCYYSWSFHALNFTEAFKKMEESNYPADKGKVEKIKIEADENWGKSE
jgi:hypothetical protein